MPPKVLTVNAGRLIDDSAAKIIDYRPNSVTVKARIEQDGFLVLSDTYFPGWRVFVDGKEDKIYRTDYLIRSVYLPRGSYEVKFVYDPLPFRVGLLISLVSVLSIIGFVGYRLVRSLC